MFGQRGKVSGISENKRQRKQMQALIEKVYVNFA